MLIKENNNYLFNYLLKEEFFETKFIIDEILKNILKAMPSEVYDPEVLNIKY